ncbi:hypothetical protein [Mycobacteroides abscessus]|uniref:hypothetical protein n=1 Tax=Mycobacteroides abscessus TaxID=36809 RepID=UPI0005DC6F92|nr:hypothetical protein [Mycobacteroides abscessus]CPR79534.1 Uncharacterised protein [Mycobacteroides abscessus]CPR88652.1 Uncharacterised protein [Mycobacteroides abscessus]CPS43592.1 Uncharacterised protein [Mycobacteroides abscessus]CPV03390.1 Uncharacterised protein [Mycobacteroides abscessus]
MNDPREPYSAPIETINHGRHDSSRVKYRRDYVGRHRPEVIAQTEALGVFFTSRDEREAASAVLAGGQ